MRIPIYSTLPPKRKQVVNMIGGGLAMAIVALAVSGFIGGPDAVKGVRASKLPKPKSLAAVPGDELDSKDAWIGNAGRDLAKLRDDLKRSADESRQQKSEQERTNRELLDQLKALRENRPIAGTAAASGAASDADGTSAEDVRRVMSKATATAASRGRAAAPAASGTPGAFPAQPRSAGRLPAPNDNLSYPPGSPNGGATASRGGPSYGMGTATTAPPQQGLVRVSMKSAASAGEAGVGTPGRRQVGSFLPVGFAKAVILGGLAAPTGGQAQSNPVPVLLRLADAAVLPNEFRAGVRDCFVVGEGYGDQSAERAYIRTTLLSCVLHNGSVLEVPLKGSIFGEDGMNGVRGTLVTKQGAILSNALLSGIASGIGQGIAQASQTISTTPLGSVSTPPTDSAGIVRQGVGTGVGKALDRLSQYYIQLAERTFPVIEVQAGRTVDVVITQGVQLDPALAAGPSTAVRRQTADRTSLLRAAQGDFDEE
ncbi:TrbI/VirB10 family protein [Ideonella sp. YS5]|uniref:TrbI/VirB10 family protein n=1 Tax=Ideonella sp. YS5 TaxID=3453714 RepID=UPI003EEFAE20